ncbi:MAG: hypothetical protein ACOCXQ_03930 [Patescibacteria group bacterium]
MTRFRFVLLLLISLLTSVFLAGFTVPVLAQEPESTDMVVSKQVVTLYLFHSETCPHCHKLREFLPKLQQDIPGLRIEEYEINNDDGALELWREVGVRLNARGGGVPFTVVGDEYVVGYASDIVTGTTIRELVLKAQDDPEYRDVVRQAATYLNNEPAPGPAGAGVAAGGAKGAANAGSPSELPESISLPLIGEIGVRDVSLPVLTFLIALMDGFNPCAMWALIFLISMLIGMHDRRRMWILGTAFILTSGAIYFLFMTAWLNFFLFIGVISWVRIAIGLLSFGAGAYYLKEFFTNKDMTCTVSHTGNRQRVFEKIKQIIHRKHIWVALIGTVLLAASVNLVEALCSAGLPAVYTQVLALSNLPVWQYYAYMLFYILIFMIDDLIVFFVAMISLKTLDTHTRYARISRLVGGVILLLLGFALVFNPGLIMFG